jgi:hypothetical protein
MVVSERLQLTPLEHLAAALLNLARCGFPHHAGALARILEALDQRLNDGFSRPRFACREHRFLQRIHDCYAEIEPLDTLRRPVGGNFVARHAPHFFGVSLEKDREQFLSELVAHPFVEIASVFDRVCLGVAERQHAGRAGEEPEIAQRLECAQWVRIIFSAVVDAREARPLDEIVGQNLLPEIDHFLRLRKETMPANVKHEAVVFDRAADAAHIDRILLDHGDREIGIPGEAIGGGQAGRPGADHEDVRMGVHRAVRGANANSR